MSNIECLFICDFIIVFCYIDNIVVLYYSQFLTKVNQFKQILFNIYKIRNINKLK